MPRKSRTDWLDRLADTGFRVLIGGLRRLPWKTRIRTMGWICVHLLGPVAGFRRRAEENLAFVFPDMDRATRRAVARECLDNMGRTIIENYSPLEQIREVATLQPFGPGWPAIEAARKTRRPIIFVSAHYGNWQAARAALNQRGYDIGGLYRPFNNPYANAHYVESIEAVGGRAYARSRRGLAAFLRTLKDGGQAAMMLDQYVADGAILDFMGQPAPTSLSAADMALRHDALLVPIYGRRLEDGFSFEMLIETPIPHTTPEEMTQALNDSLAHRIRETPGQWFWMHRRWKPGRLARRMAREAQEAGTADGPRAGA
ncbi:lysophospholipid acyltransferase family protein [Roseibacterium sp. SDUM158016]|uniref:lysophospholipid acyltransferase family protein n=1 Tax=Roseicyclus sediminis TaxID=2980997 RepID=UPI0021D1AEB7|nr:lysophospholipid acyltransferase family protein [Roseibacterium sp. SDUM158016]MCU4653889.1 lysophospholipid acyltransferase family protein [Roseibacterium sp. SDUM158016]